MSHLLDLLQKMGIRFKQQRVRSNRNLPLALKNAWDDLRKRDHIYKIKINVKNVEHDFYYLLPEPHKYSSLKLAVGVLLSNFTRVKGIRSFSTFCMVYELDEKDPHSKNLYTQQKDQAKKFKEVFKHNTEKMLEAYLADYFS